MASATVRVERLVRGDSIVMGGNVDVMAPVSGDVVVAGLLGLWAKDRGDLTARPPVAVAAA